jgi:CheY-like chemotaxis protein
VATVLVIDDHESDRDLLATVLAHCGHEVIAAVDGEQGLELVTEHRPELIFTDILMPKVDGYEFVQRLRALPGARDVPVVFCTATYSLVEVRAVALGYGVSELLQKPYRPAEVIAMTSEILGVEAPALPPGAVVDEVRGDLFRDRLVEKQGVEDAVDRERQRLLADSGARPSSARGDEAHS